MDFKEDQNLKRKHILVKIDVLMEEDQEKENETKGLRVYSAKGGDELFYSL